MKTRSYETNHRVVGSAFASVAHREWFFARELNPSELWALPTTLRVVLVENLRRLVDQSAES